VVKSELVAALARDNPDLLPAAVERIVSCLFDAITDHLAQGGRVEMRGFGTFCTRARDGRTGRNPRTGEAVAVTAKRVPHFKSGKAICSRLNMRDE
jgi:integration host factor subunit beta